MNGRCRKIKDDMRHYSIEDQIPFILFFAVFIIYLSTVCPTVYVGDSGELTTAAFSLGVPHPSGYPLFALIGKIFCLIPAGSIGFRVNLMSAVFSSLTVFIVYSIIYRLTSSTISSIFGASILAFTQIFWLQTVSAEVYPLHTFFVALIIRLLVNLDKAKNLASIALFAFVVGLSFLNHLQTVMMAPAVLYLLIVSDRKSILNLKTLTFTVILFSLALTAYIYLPIRTHAGAAIHWGDPDTLKNFFNVVTGANHRSNYTFNRSISDFILRSESAFITVIKQFGFALVFAVWGFMRAPGCRWRIFFSSIVFFDFFYTIFLNTVFIEITAFNLPTLIVLSILSGIGINDILNRCRNIAGKEGTNIYRIAGAACFIVPAVFLVSNYNACDQSKNYNGYEHSLNTFRTVNRGGTLFVDGDNHIFPITYTRFVERMREDVTVYDKKNLFFIMPQLDGTIGEVDYEGNWNNLIESFQKDIIEERVNDGVYFLVFDPYSMVLPRNFRLVPYGTLLYVIGEGTGIDKNRLISVWKYYATESLEDTFYLDYMNRQIIAYYNFVKGRHLILLGGAEPGLRRMKMASRIGYNDEIIHNELALFYTDHGFYDMAEGELKKALIYSDDPATVYNNWGFYYSKRGDIDNAIASIRKAVDLNPDNTVYYNNLGNLLLQSGHEDEAVSVLRKSLSLDNDQEEVKTTLSEIDSYKATGE